MDVGTLALRKLKTKTSQDFQYSLPNTKIPALTTEHKIISSYRYTQKEANVTQIPFRSRTFLCLRLTICLNVQTHKYTHVQYHAMTF